MRITRRRFFLLVLASFAAVILVLAIVDRKAAYVTLYVVGALLLLLGAAAGMGGGGGVMGPVAGGQGDAASVYRQNMQQRLGWLSQNMLLLLAGALCIGIAFLLELA